MAIGRLGESEGLDERKHLERAVQETPSLCGIGEALDKSPGSRAKTSRVACRALVVGDTDLHLRPPGSQPIRGGFAEVLLPIPMRN